MLPDGWGGCDTCVGKPVGITAERPGRPALEILSTAWAGVGAIDVTMWLRNSR